MSSYKFNAFILTVAVAICLLFGAGAVAQDQKGALRSDARQSVGDGGGYNPFGFAVEEGPGRLLRPKEAEPAQPVEEKDRVKQEETPEKAPEKSTVENLFLRPPVPVGTALGGESRIAKDVVGKDVDKKKEKIVSEEEKKRAYFLLFAEREELSAVEKSRLYQTLDAKQKQSYLQSLSPQERKSFLTALGEEARWYNRDLKPGEIDRDLKQFGYDFFKERDAGQALSPELLAPVGPDYVVGPGDTLDIDIWGAINGNFEVTVDRSGDIVIPKIGAVHVWGQSFAQAKETIHRKISKYYNNFELNVAMGALRSIQVYLVGEANNPGTYTLSSVSSILNALAAAGGPTKTGSLRNVQLVRQGKVVSTVDFYDFFLAGDRSRDVRLHSGDTIHVPVAGPQVGVAGDVRRPAIYELKSQETLRDILQMAGWVNATAYLKKVQVERVQAHRARTVIDLDLDDLAGRDGEVLDFPLQDRDLIKVAPIAQVANQYVWLKGYVAHPGPYQLTPGLRLADLLLSYDNLLPYYYPGTVELLRLQPPLYKPQRATVNLEKALAGDPEHNIALWEHDEIRVFSRDEMEETTEISISGAVLNPGDFRLYDNMRVRDLVVAAGNLKRSAYLGQAELTRFVAEGEETRTNRLIIDLERALAGDPGNNLLLQPNDSLFVRAIPDFAEKQSVELKGEVRFPGVYTLAKGEHLSSVIARAGGFTDKAYLRGAVFSRESLKEQQRERLEKLIRDQEQEVVRASAEIAQGALTPEELRSAESILTARQQLVQKLIDLPVTGRMVVHMAPLEDFRGSEYDVELMGGDALAIPENPQSVTVLGQVYNPVSLTFRPGKTVSYYLNNVGGPKEDADTSEMFVVRADGTVYSKQQAGMGVRWDSENFRWVFGGFNNTPLYPGDTVLVPEKFARIDIMREIKDLTQIFYQIALGAAAVASF